jgi:UDP-N-acetylmuramoyl-L-alanyl-D-glutamate--2,6-diaminopimelate ligase
MKFCHSLGTLCSAISSLSCPLAWQNISIESLAWHHEKVKPHSLFFAIPGRRHDGHAHVVEAAALGASAAIVETYVYNSPIPQLLVANVRQALAQMARVFYNDPCRDMIVVGVTGTNGKTTVSALLAPIFQQIYGKYVGCIGTLGAHYADKHWDTSLTTPMAPVLLAILSDMRCAGVRAVVLEASSMALAQYRLDGCLLDAAIWTNLTPEHLDDHGSMELYQAAKCRLLRHLKPSGVVIKNADDKHWQALAWPRLYAFSRQSTAAEVYLEATRVGSHSTQLQLSLEKQTFTCETTLAGDFNIENILAAVTCAHALGIHPERIAQGVAQINTIPGRMEWLHHAVQDIDPNPKIVIDYAHTPAALDSVLRSLRTLCPPKSRLWCVFGCGGERDPAKRAIMGAIAEKWADYTVVTDDNPRGEDPNAIIQAILAGMKTNHYRIIRPRQDAIQWAIQQAQPQDIVLLAGRGHETQPFSDRDIAEAAWKNRQRLALCSST